MSSEPQAIAQTEGVDGDAINEVLGATETGDSLGQGGTNSIVSRLMNRSPDPQLDEMDDMGENAIGTKRSAFKFLQRGIGKFTQAGGTALEDFVWAGVNYGLALFKPAGEEELTPTQGEEGGEEMEISRAGE